MEARKKVQRVAILFQYPLIGRAIKELLGATDSIEIVACLQDKAEAWSQVLQLNPDVIIKVGEEGKAPPAALLPWLPDETVRLIHLGSAGNELRLYHARQMAVTCVEDLIQVIQAGGEGVAAGAMGT